MLIKKGVKQKLLNLLQSALFLLKQIVTNIVLSFLAQHGQWVGTVLLNGCEILERPSKKEGFCFKIYHPLEHYIWATKGPKGEMAGSITQPLPKDHLILRADSESDGKWI